MVRTLKAVLVLLLLAALTAPAATLAGGAKPYEYVAKGKPPGSFKQIGHEPLMNRGMNAGLAVHGKYAYIGSRTDGLHPNAGVMVVNISKPSAPRIVHQIGMPNEGNVGETSRELRIWPEKKLLIVMNLGSNCSFIIHACSPTQLTVADNFRFYDISGKNAASPKLVAEYEPSVNPHEMFLWDDPKRKGRAILFLSTPGGGQTQMLVTDISGARKKKFKELLKWSVPIPSPGTDNRLHSLSVTNSGKRAFLSYLGGGVFAVDTSDVARGKANPKIKPVTPITNRVHWGDPGAHSAVKLYGRPWVLTTDEVYGYAPVLLADHGCPWGWVRLVDYRDANRPKVAAEYKLEQNTAKYCDAPADNTPVRNSTSSWASHNPTLTKHLAFVSWHSGGLQAIDLSTPARPKQAAQWSPAPLPAVTQEDPALSSGQDKVVVWSYPIIQKGLIYVVDVRNGLYILKYKGPYAQEVSSVRFIEGNSNLGTALRFEKP